MKLVHSIWGVLVLVVLITAVVNSIIGLVQKRDFTHKDFRLGLFTIIVTHTQFLIGFIAYIAGGFYLGLGDMGVAAIRFLSLEHPLMMLIAITLITIGWSKHKKKFQSHDKFKMFSIFFSLGLLVMLSRIPWGNWMNTWF